MISNFKKEKIIIFTLILILIVGTLYFYSFLPEKITTHWNAYGQADGYSSKLFGISLVPILTIILTLLFFFIPRIDPLKANIKKFQNNYFLFIIVFILFMMAVQTQTILWSLGIKINTNFLFPIAIGILFIFISFLLKNSKRNWFIGIRTPWTLLSDKVWKKTHDLGSKLFFIDGILSIIGIFFGIYSWLFILIPVITSSIFLIIYSYVIYKKN